MNRIVTILSWSAALAAVLGAPGCSQTPGSAANPTSANKPALTAADCAEPSSNPKTTAQTPDAEDDIDKLIDQLKGEDAGVLNGSEDSTCVATPAKVKVPQYLNDLGLTKEQKDKIRRIAAALDPQLERLQELLNAARKRARVGGSDLLILTLGIKKLANNWSTRW